MSRNVIKVYEHQTLKKDQVIDPKNNIKFTESHLKHFKRFYKKEIERKDDEKSNPVYFTLISDGIKFSEYVGVIKVGNLIVEVLPKVDKVDISGTQEDKKVIWQKFLYQMFNYAADVNGHITSYSPLKYHNNNFLDLYLSYFINEVDYLIKTGLIKKYHKIEGNLNALKGSIIFPKHLTKNIVHQEKFYCRYSVYDTNNFFNQILYKALTQVKRINTSPRLTSKIEGLILNFPEMKNIEVNDALFEKIVYDRKSESYKKAIDLAKFILLNLHPDVSKGQSDTLAIMFDMNRLWEVFIYKKLKEELRKSHPHLEVKDQDNISFWKRDKARAKTRTVKADIVIREKTKEGDKLCRVVLDTKWKIEKKYSFPDQDNLKQMFVYNQLYFKDTAVKKSALVYPSNEIKEIEAGKYLSSNNQNFGTCSLVFIKIEHDTNKNELRVNLDKLKDFIVN